MCRLQHSAYSVAASKGVDLSPKSSFSNRTYSDTTNDGRMHKRNNHLRSSDNKIENWGSYFDVSRVLKCCFRYKPRGANVPDRVTQINLRQSRILHKDVSMYFARTLLWVVPNNPYPWFSSGNNWGQRATLQTEQSGAFFSAVFKLYHAKKPDWVIKSTLRYQNRDFEDKIRASYIMQSKLYHKNADELYIQKYNKNTDWLLKIFCL